MRNHFLDTHKAILIFLVVFGHFLERMIGWRDPISHTLLGTVYLIHMPAFIFVSGILYKDKNWLKNTLFFLSLYIPFQFLFAAFDGFWSGQIHWNWNVFIKPYWVLWYLFAMMAWTCLTHFLLKVSNGFALIFSLLMAVFIGLSPWNNYLYSSGRIFVFFPFFIFGVIYGKSMLEKIQQQATAKYYGLMGLMGLAAFVYFTHINPYWLYGSLSYSQLKVTVFDGIFIRIFVLILSSFGIVALLSVTQFFQGKWQKLGIYTLPVYLLHGFVVMWIARYYQVDFHIFLEILICIILSILSCWVLQQAFFDQLLRKMSLWLLKPTAKFWHMQK